MTLSGRLEAPAGADKRATARKTLRLAARHGVSRQSVWYWECGKRQPKPAMLAAIAKQFGVSERELAGDEPGHEPATADLGLWKSRIAERFGVAADKVRILIEF
jgi:transcriptional regulator with XRE-family HTH domain